MKLMYVVMSVLILFCAADVYSDSSPAATRDWVRKYVSTNSVPARPGVSEDWVVNYIRTSGVLSASSVRDESSFSSNTVNGIINNIRFNFTMASSLLTNDAYSVAWIPSDTNLLDVILAPVDDDVWTNSVKEVSLVFFETGTVFNTSHALSFSSTNDFSGASSFRLTEVGSEGTNSVSFVRTSVSDETIRKVKGE